MRHRMKVWKLKAAMKAGSDYEINYVVRSAPRSLKFWRLKHLKQQSAWTDPKVDEITVGSRMALSRNDIVKRLNAAICESCNTTAGPFEVHHVRHMKDMLASSLGLKHRAERLRKTAVLCKPCHVALHAGRQFAKGESRVH
jgi:hypothetical protein